MNKIEDIVRKTISDYEMVEAEQKVLVAISGGPDSIFLAQVLRQLGYVIGLAHVNFQLRKEDSEADEALVKAYADQWKVPFYGLKAATEEYALKHKLSTQMAARQIRYEYFEEIMHRHGYACCATAHHLDDQTESILMSWLKGQSSRIIKGIPPVRRPYIRPLIQISKKQIFEALDQAQLEYRLDKSNLKNDYLRNQIRNQVIPLLKEINPKLDRQFQDQLARINLQADFIDHQIQAYLPSGENPYRLNWLPFVEEIGEKYLPILVLKTAELWDIRGYVAFRLTELIDAQVGKYIDSPIGRISRSRKGIYLRPIDSRDFYSSDLSSSLISKSQLSDRFFSISYPNNELHLRIIKTAEIDFQLKQHYFLDLAKIQFPLLIRNWEQGDRMIPLGMKSHKKLSDIFIDEKYDLDQKNSAIIIEDQERIISLIPFRISEAVKIDSGSQHVLEISWEELFNEEN